MLYGHQLKTLVKTRDPKNNAPIFKHFNENIHMGIYSPLHLDKAKAIFLSVDRPILVLYSLSYLNYNPSHFFFEWGGWKSSGHDDKNHSKFRFTKLKSVFCAAQESYNIAWSRHFAALSKNFSPFQHPVLPSHPWFQVMTKLSLSLKSKEEKWFAFPLPHQPISFHRTLFLVWKLNFTRCQLFFSN